MMPRLPALLLASTGLALGACTARELPHCGDGMPEVGHACLEAQEVQAEALLALGDADGDGLDDAVVVQRAEPFRVAVQRGRADATLAPVGAGIASTNIPTAAAVGDTDADGRPEVLLWWPDEAEGRICAHDPSPEGALLERWCIPGHERSSALSVWLRVGRLGPAGEAGVVAWAGRETMVVVDPAGAATETRLPMTLNRNGTIELALADLDGDGRDALLWVGDDYIETYDLATGVTTGTPVPGALGRPLVADFDGDGTDDLALHSGWGLGPFEVQLELSSGPRVTAAFGAGDLTVPMAGDLDGDGRAELMVETDEGLLGLWGHDLAEGGAPLEPTVLDAGPASDGLSTLRLADLDGDGIQEVLRVAGGGDESWDGLYFPRWITEVWRGNP